ncbi:PREDICTED: monoacylglycerol lipase ABHD12 isoform X2 [Bactrocera latifrons]|uniref:monoacylglycerol lipase ABHD12 isoform X2 n=1 Tax=Bactrocera latifrons TaxID=174628 RepID=UPI0008DC6B11|nr:PREDICTED: monoacylglycerol lipase ABHD12 isoform X2 [Bactrocera latifrons]XP_018792021.1 PREDICTED: monoacylglycerol lipase ABHD12 isoform X2 [Bactrocera latifrons]XP_018792022.1 PREDICTED: monoacylglycerol lipase ABHD12 isoform X2 [Bactrocera latifrons]
MSLNKDFQPLIDNPPTTSFYNLQIYANFFTMYESYKFLNVIFRASVIPGALMLIWLTGIISLTVVQLCMLVFLIIFVGFPLIFRYSITLQRGILFLTFITYPKDLDLSKPASVGLFGTRSLNLSVLDPDVEERHDGVRIGVWHVLPLHLAKRFAKELKIDTQQHDELKNTTFENDESLDKLEPILKSEFSDVTAENEALFYERMLKLPSTIVLYLHGNTASRGSGHRVEMYQLLRKLGCHVLTLDYRGYGDSDPVSPTEEGIVRDALTVYEYIRNVTTNPIFIWGHSLGTGVACHLCSQLNLNFKMDLPRGVILEAPFTNIRDEIRLHPFARPFKDLPWFDLTIARPMYSNKLRFESDKHISEFRQPVMILHAEDDYVVPFELGYKLYRTALDTRAKTWGPVEFHRFNGVAGYGHKFLCRAPELPVLAKQFIETYRNEDF